MKERSHRTRKLGTAGVRIDKLTSTVGLGAVVRSGLSAGQGHTLAGVVIVAGENTNQAINKRIHFIEIDIVGNNDLFSFSVSILVDFDA